MFDVKNNKFGYTTGLIFTLTGEDYTGYYNVVGGKGYVGKNSQVFELTNKSNFANDIVVSDITFDRSISERPVLPHKLEEVKFKINEFITADSVNEKLNKLNYNNDFLYSRFFLANTDIPVGVTATICVTGSDSNLQFFSNFTDLSTFNFEANYTSQPFDLNLVVGIEAMIDSNENNFVIFIPKSTSLVALTGSLINQTVGIGLSTNYTDDTINNIVSYEEIADIASYENDLFVVDKKARLIYRYDTEGLYIDDPGFDNKRFLLESAGNSSVNPKLQLGAPSLVTASKDSVFVYDEKNKYIKQLDYNFNVISSKRLFRFKEQVLSLGYNNFYNFLSIITLFNGKVYYNRYQNLVLVDRTDLGIILNDDEKILKTLYSENSSDIFYVVTTGSLYKKYLTTITPTVGIFNDENLQISNPSGKYTGCALLPSTDNYDLMFVGKQDRLIVVKEQNRFNTVLRDSNIDNYDVDSIAIKKSEYIQANYFNKEMFKVISNLYKLKNQLIGSFLTKYVPPAQHLTYQQSINSITEVFVGTSYLTEYDILQIDDVNNLYLHENEPVCVGSINRCITYIYNLQANMLAASQPVNNTLVQYLTSDGVLELT